MANKITICVLMCLSHFVVLCQNTRSLHVLDANQKNIPLSTFDFNGKTYFTDATSSLEIDASDTAFSKNKSDSLILPLYFSILQLSFTSKESFQLIKTIIKQGKNNQLEALAPFSYKAYNKFSIQSSKTQESQELLQKIINKFKPFKEQIEYNRHLVLSESISERSYYDHLHQLETVLWSKISGLDQPLVFSLNSQLQTIDLHQKYLRILGKKFVNPLNINAINSYHYSVADSFTSSNDSFIKINFHPKKRARFESIKGFLWINTKDNGIYSFYCEPVYGRRMKKSFAIQFEEKNKQYIPKTISTTLNLDNISSQNLSFSARQTTYISAFTSDKQIIKNQFSDLVLDYRTQTIDTVLRTIPLTATDSNTYNYFTDNKKQLTIHKYLMIGEQFYFGKIRTKYADIYLKDLVDYNQYENLRIGLGLSTNNLLSTKHQLYSKIAYGTQDKAWKGALSYKYKIVENDKLTLNIGIENDLIESGSLDKTLYTPYYSTEFLRRIELSKFDQQFKSSVEIIGKPIKYVYSSLKLDIFKDLTHHQFALDPQKGNLFRELKLNIKYSFGEQFYRLYSEQLPLKTDYPTYWLTIEKSIANSSYSYTRLLLRARYTHDFIINGTSHFDCIVGNYWGELPYFKLFNGLGSSSLKATIHNSFETMNYNEFSSSRFALLFYVHDFGNFNFTQRKTFRPSIETSLSLGIGSLNKQAKQKFVALQTFNKGYAEAGLSINDLLLIYPFGIKIGFGVSFYHRLSYRYPSFRENSIIKLTTGFVI